MPRIMMAKSSGNNPLSVISPNGATIASRTRSRGKSASGPQLGGKENGKSARQKAISIQDVETSKGSGGGRIWKRARSSASGRSQPGARAGAQNSSRTEAARAGAHDNFSSENENDIDSRQTPVRHDLLVSGGAALRVPEVQEPLNEYRRVACSFDQAGATVQVQGTTSAATPVHQKPVKMSCTREIVSDGESESGSERSEVVKRRRALVECSGWVPQDDGGASAIPANPDECQHVESARCIETADPHAPVAPAELLQISYDKLFKKYQHLKMRQIANAEEAIDEQSRRVEKFSTAADDLLQNLRRSTSISQSELDFRSRAREMEAMYLECRNDLVIERAKNLELQQQLDCYELRESSLTDKVLQNVTHLTILKHGKSDMTFSHDDSGFEFALEQNCLSEKVGGKDALLYRVVAPGTLVHVAPDWMLGEIVFDLTQVNVCFERILAVALGNHGCIQ